MKKIASILVISFLTIATSAQSLIPMKYGIKFGVNISNIISTPNEGVKNIETSSQIGIARQNLSLATIIANGIAQKISSRIKPYS